jgi:hypothetical protein
MSGIKQLDALLAFLAAKGPDGQQAATVFARACAPMPEHLKEVDQRNAEMRSRLRKMMPSVAPDKVAAEHKKVAKDLTAMLTSTGPIFKELIKITTARRATARMSTLGYINKKMGMDIVVPGVTKQTTEAQQRAAENSALYRAKAGKLRSKMRKGFRGCLAELDEIQQKAGVEPEQSAENMQMIVYKASQVEDLIKQITSAWFPDEEQLREAINCADEEADKLFDEADKLFEEAEKQAAKQAASGKAPSSKKRRVIDDDDTDDEEEATTSGKRKREETEEEATTSAPATKKRKDKGQSRIRVQYEFEEDDDEDMEVSGSLQQYINVAHDWWNMEATNPKRHCTADKKASAYYENHVVYTLQHLRSQFTEDEIKLETVLDQESKALTEWNFFKSKPCNKVVTPWNRYKAYLAARQNSTVQTMLRTAPTCPKTFKQSIKV